HRPDQPPVRGQVEVDDLCPGRRVDMAERREGAELRGIAEEDVEPAVAVEQLCREFVDLDEIAQVDRNERGAAAGSPDRVVDFFETPHRARRQDNMRALGGKAQSNGGADAARGPGDQRDSVGEAPGAARLALTRLPALGTLSRTAQSCP